MILVFCFFVLFNFLDNVVNSVDQLSRKNTVSDKVTYELKYAAKALFRFH